MMNEKNKDRLMYNITNQGETKNTNVIKKYTENNKCLALQIFVSIL